MEGSVEMMDERQKAGDVISCMEMCSIGVNLQRGMNFRLWDGFSVATHMWQIFASRVEVLCQLRFAVGKVGKLKESTGC
jgi:hypothetical protein